MNKIKIAKWGQHNLPYPAAATSGAAALDVRTTEHVVLFPGDDHLVGTGFAYEAPPGHALLLIPRSGLGATYGIVLGNTVGLIDPDYRGELKVSLWYRRSEGPPITLQRGERVAQLICVPFHNPMAVLLCNIEDLSHTDRGEGGFGSTETK